MSSRTYECRIPVRCREALGPAGPAAPRGHGPYAWALYALAMALAGMPAGCSNSPYPDKDANANTVYSSITEEPLTMDPAVTYGGAQGILMNIVETPVQYNYLDRPYKLEPLLATEVPKVEFRKVQYDGNTIDAPVYTVHIKKHVRYQNHPCFVEVNRHLTGEDLTGIRSVADFKKTAAREMTADDFVYGIRRLCDPRIQFPVYGQFSTNLLGFDGFNKFLKARLDADRKKRAEAAGALYNQEMDEQFNPIPMDYNEGADAFPFVRKVDRYTFEVVLSRQYPQIVYWMVFGFFSPVPREAVEFFNQTGLIERGITFARNPVGTGPYVVETYDPTSQVVLVRNPNFRTELYPFLSEPGPDTDQEAKDNYALMKDNGMLEDAGQELPFIDRLVFRIERESIPRWNKFMQGYYDTSGVQTETFDQSVSLSSQGELGITDDMKERGLRLLKTNTASLGYYAFNMQDPVFGGYDEKKRKLRQAISIAIDAGESIDIFQNGMALEAQGPIPPGIFGHEPGEEGINPYVFRWDARLEEPVRRSIDEAKELLAEAGYPGGYAPDGHPLVVHYVTASISPQASSALKLLRKQLGRINVRLETDQLSYNEFFKKVSNGGFQLASFGWAADYPDPETFLILFYKPDATSTETQNMTGYDNARYKELFQKMSRMEDSPERLEIIREMLAILRKDAPVVFFSHGVAIALTHSWLHNYFPYPLTTNTAKYLIIDPAARTAYRKEHNQSDYWPVAILIGALAALTLPAVLVTRRHLREK